MIGYNKRLIIKGNVLIYVYPAMRLNLGIGVTPKFNRGREN
jgi:hypothetical protein